MNRQHSGATTMDSNRVLIREATPDDLPALQSFVAGLSTASRASRFFVPVAELPLMLTQALASRDPLHHFLVARAVKTPDGEGAVLALAQYARHPPPAPICEIALVVADAWQGRGLGRQLMLRLLAHAERQGLELVVGDILRQNRAMISLARSVDFRLQRHPEDPILVQVVRSIRMQSSPAGVAGSHRAAANSAPMAAAA